MARTTIPLTDTKIKTAKPTDKEYTLQDGNGLYLLIKPTGSKIWRFNYYRPITKKRTLVSFGSYPAVSLADARQKRENAKELLAKGIDLQEHKQAEEQQLFEEKNNTFEKIASDWFKVKSKSNLQETTLKDIWRSLELHVFPTVGNTAITELKARHFITALEPLKAQGKLESVKRVAQRINEIMYYAALLMLIQQLKSPLHLKTQSSRIYLHYGLNNCQS